MRKKLLFLVAILGASFVVSAQVLEYKIITSIESIVPLGIGRSRLIDVYGLKNYKDFTITQSGDEDKQVNKAKRDEVRTKDYNETKLLNFFNFGGISMENIASNDAVVTSKINDLVSEGWELKFVASGVESVGGDKDNNGIFITRYIFARPKK